MPQAFQEFTLGGDGFEGTFDSVRIWNRALSTVMPSYWICPKTKQDSLPIGVWRKGKASISMIPLVNIMGSLIMLLGSIALEPINKASFSFILMVPRLPSEIEQSYTIPSNDNQFSIGGYKTASSKESLLKEA